MGRQDVEIQPEELRDRLAAPEPPLLLDVRRYDEHAIAAFENAVLIPLDELEGRASELDQNRETVVYCHHGVRSLGATMFLRAQGFANVKSLAGGIDRWSIRIDPRVPRY